MSEKISDIGRQMNRIHRFFKMDQSCVRLVSQPNRNKIRIIYIDYIGNYNNPVEICDNI